ncbi:MAG: nucleotidyltransferase domain-containing protein [Actinomycetaceae bacterium]|nr:nucleotidyltransferase domain-containing protein [Actinomycetaceae bacterium]
MEAQLLEVAQRTDHTIREARNELVSAVRSAYRSGMTQREIADAVGRSQAEVSRLLHFHGDSRLGKLARKHRKEIIDVVERMGGKNVRIFGSVVHGTDDEDSDIDLLFSVVEPMSLMTLVQAEFDLEALLGVKVDLVSDEGLNPAFAERILMEAVPL